MGAVVASTYNTRALVPEVLVRKGEWALVRPRIAVQDLIALDRMTRLALTAPSRGVDWL